MHPREVRRDERVREQGTIAIAHTHPREDRGHEHAQPVRVYSLLGRSWYRHRTSLRVSVPGLYASIALS